MDQLLDVSEPTKTELFSADYLIFLACAVLRLVPAPGEETARVALIHVGLDRALEALSPPGTDCLALALDAHCHSACPPSIEPRSDLARVLSLVYSVYAGDVPDPSFGASLVILQDAEPPVGDLICTALLGNFLFFKNKPPF